MSGADAVYRDLEKIRANKPLVLNLTNYVVANTNANALLALGASPAMTHNPRDLEELTAFAAALVVNIGTPTEEFLEGMFTAARVANEKQTPIVLDPVAAGATSVRTDSAHRFVKEHHPAVIRGNGSEIMALAGAGGEPHGADSSQSSDSAVQSARELARRFGCVVCVSGETDYVTDGEQLTKITGGSAMMPYVTGLGCTSTAIIGAFAAVNPNAMEAAAHAMAVMAVCGEHAAARAEGPGTLQLHFYDALYNLDRDMLSGCGVAPA